MVFLLMHDFTFIYLDLAGHKVSLSMELENEIFIERLLK